VICDDNVSLSELTPAEHRMPETISWPFTITRLSHLPRKAEDQENIGQPRPREMDMLNASDNIDSESLW
jgi:hypothetical protein